MLHPIAIHRGRLIAACAAGLLLLLAACFWAGLNSNLPAALRAIAASPWGLVTLIDLYIGLAVVATCIFALEQNKIAAVAWIAGLLLLGNIMTLAWLISRALRNPP